MALTKKQKSDLINDLKEKMPKAKSLVFTDYQGLKVNEIQELRRKLRKKNVEYKVMKTTLIKRVVDDLKIDIDQSIYKKPVALALSEMDEVEPSKIIHDFTLNNEKLQILGGIVNGSYYDFAQIVALAKMPSREELYAKVVGSISSPLSGFVNVLSGNLRGLVSVLKQYHEQKSN